MPANEVASLYTKDGKVKAGNQYSLNLSLEVKFEEKRKFRKLKKYVASTNILHLHFELVTDRSKKEITQTTSRCIFSDDEKIQKKTSLFYQKTKRF